MKTCDMTAGQKQATEDTFETLGRQAFAAGEHSAPALNPIVQQAITGLPVGGGAARIMAAFSRGWHDANLAAELPSDDSIAESELREAVRTR